MIEVTFYTQGSVITGFQVQGHSGLADQGEDILCAAVTSVVRLCECVVNDVLGLKAAVQVVEDDALISLKLPGSLGSVNDSICQSLLTGLMLYTAQLHGEYPEHISVFDCEV